MKDNKMKTSNHTPGPFISSGSGTILDSKKRTIAVVMAPRGEISLSEAEANEKLFIASYDMLKVLREIISECDAVGSPSLGTLGKAKNIVFDL